MPVGTVTTFDKKTHRPVQKRTTRLTYSYYAAHFLDDLEAEEITEKVLRHLQGAQRATENVWGLSAWSNVAKQRPAELNEYTRAAVEGAIGPDALEGLNGQPLGSLPQDEQQKAVRGLGQRGLSETYRRLLLRVISELWVEYLTSMEALRISVRLEAYAQRDPLVEYKAQAFRMFQQLFDDMRSTVVNRMFTYRPRSAQQAAQAAAMAEAPPDAAPEDVVESTGNGAAEPAAADPGSQADSQPQKNGGRKRRRRRRKK
jgi:preprotein translocase subunit SecA